MTHDTTSKPVCRLTGTDGNVYTVIGAVVKALERSKLKNGYELAANFQRKAFTADSYDAVLQLCSEYVEVV
jgi:hypothetical protein